MAQRDQRTDSAQRAAPVAASHRTARPQPREPRRALRRLRGSQRFLPVLVVVAIVSTFGLASITYIAARANASAQAQTEALRDAQVARQLVADQGPGLTLSNDQLVVGADNSVYTLNGETTLVDRTRALTGDYATIYQLEGSRLIAVASNLPSGASGRALGDSLGGSAFTALVGNCGAVDSQSCHQAYSGQLTLHGTDYVVGVQPLFDATGAFVGALGAAQPLSAVLAPVNQFAVVLLLVGLLLSFLCIIGGHWLFGSRSERMLAMIDARLDAVAEAATDLERLAQAQIVRATGRGRAARELHEHTHALDTLAAAMEEGQASLRESAGGIWNEMSQPGAAPDPRAAIRWARESAVVSSRVGTAAERARDVCRQLGALMNHIVAENNVATDAGREMQFHARELRRSVEGVESALGERLIARPQDAPASPLVRRMRRWLPSHANERPSTAGNVTTKAPQKPPSNGHTGQRPAAGRGQQSSEPLVSESLWVGKGSRTPTGEQGVPRLGDLSGQAPRPASQPQRPGATGEYPRPGSWKPGQSGLWGQAPSSGSTPRTGQSPRLPKFPSTPSMWTGDFPAAPGPLRQPPTLGAGRDQSAHGPVGPFSSTGHQDTFQWHPPSAPRTPDRVQGTTPTPSSSQPDDSQAWPWFDTGSVAFDSNEHPRRDPGLGPGPRWPEE